MDCEKDAIGHPSVKLSHHCLSLQLRPVRVVPGIHEKPDQRGRKLLLIDPLWGLGYGLGWLCRSWGYQPRFAAATEAMVMVMMAPAVPCLLRVRRGTKKER